MSVLVSDRRESKLEVIVFADELHNMLIELMQRSFGVKDVDRFVRIEYAYGALDSEDFAYYRFLMNEAKKQMNQTATLLTDNLRAANSIYQPQSMEEYHTRRKYQDMAIANCDQLRKQLQHVVTVFNVDVNVYGRYIKAINREIDLIKKWRQRDNKLKTYLQG